MARIGIRSKNQNLSFSLLYSCFLNIIFENSYRQMNISREIKTIEKNKKERNTLFI